MNRRTTLAVLIITASAIISLLTIFLQRQSRSVCHYDGAEIMPIYEADITLDNGDVLKFCCVHCARAWLKGNDTAAATVTVTDELTGEKLDSSLAIFVESDVVSVPATRNRIHVFRDDHHAQEHARRYHGQVVDNPFSPEK